MCPRLCRIICTKGRASASFCETNSIAFRIVSEQADICYLVLLKLRKLCYYLAINFYDVLFNIEVIDTLRF